MKTKQRALSLALSTAVILMSMPLMSSAERPQQSVTCKSTCTNMEGAAKKSCMKNCLETKMNTAPVTANVN